MPSSVVSIISPAIDVSISEIMTLETENQNKGFDHPLNTLQSYAKNWQLQIATQAFADKLDEVDPLKHTRQEFHIPKLNTLPKVKKTDDNDNNKECIYFCGHSLGLQSKRVKNYIDTWLKDWANLGVYGHTNGTNPFAYCDYPCLPTMAKLVGAEDKEVGVMNQLTTNIHFLMVAFYRPNKDRYKILYEKGAFPSDEYAIHSQIKFHGYDANEGSIQIEPRENDTYIRTEDILRVIEEQGSKIALVLLSGVQFFTGQLFDIPTITQAAQKKGCVVGWDLAHAVGNVPLYLHDWNVDFAAWCTYKYLNSGAGCIGGLFVHSNHFNENFTRFDGWWGNRDDTRFKMFPKIEHGMGADGFRMSNPSIHQCATLRASLENFEEAGFENLRKKSKLLTQYLYDLIETEINQKPGCFTIKILTPADPEQRGAQLSLQIIGIEGIKIFEELQQMGVCLDLRGDTIRVAPIPLYNTFSDVFHFVSLLKKLHIQNE